MRLRLRRERVRAAADAMKSAEGRATSSARKAEGVFLSRIAKKRPAVEDLYAAGGATRAAMQLFWR